MSSMQSSAAIGVCRSPSGERGLKYTELVLWDDDNPGRSPSGERGLKSPLFGVDR